MTERKNILIIGRTGSGKSALANLLVNEEKNFKEDAKFEEIFSESDSSVSETKSIQSKEVEINGVSYYIVDTKGMGNDSLTHKEVLFNTAKACYECKEGFSQILFVIGGRFSLEEIKIYNIIKKKLLDEDITKHTTIVRTKFHNFR